MSMTPDEFCKIREELRVGVVAFGRALGYQGESGGVSRQVRRIENGTRPIPLGVQRRARDLLALHRSGRLGRLREDGKADARVRSWRR